MTRDRGLPDHASMSSNLQSAQFGNPFVAIGGLLSSAGANGWFRRRAELRHAYNMKLIDMHFQGMQQQRPTTEEPHQPEAVAHEPTGEAPGMLASPSAPPRSPRAATVRRIRPSSVPPSGRPRRRP